MWSDKLAEQRFYNLLRRRDRKAMEFLYDHYSAVMFGIIIKITRNQALAEDVLTKTFNYIWKNYKELDTDKQSVCTWLINVTRKMCRETVSFKQFTQIDTNKMSGKQVFELLFFGNGSIAEVAKHTGMSEIEIKAHLRDTIGQLNRISEKA